MAKRKISNLLALAVLSLLTERPMHPYEVSSVMQERELSAVVKLNNSSLYSVIEALQREGLIVPVEIQREGRYPERTIYVTTEAGQAELSDWLRSLLGKPTTEYTSFAAALAFLVHLPPNEVVTLLEEHMQYLHQEVNNIQLIIEKSLQMGVDRIFIVEDYYTLTLLEARISFIRQFVHDINDGTLTELKNEKQVWKIVRPELSSLGSEMEKERKAEDTF
jgi:DNA-binding PadR family transcriptional regulator